MFRIKVLIVVVSTVLWTLASLLWLLTPRNHACYSSQSANYSELQGAIHFILVTPSLQLNSRQECSIHSAIKSNPARKVVLWHTHITPPVLKFTKTIGNKINLQQAELEILFSATPLTLWFNKPSSRKSQFYRYFLSDALRLAILYKFGGTYLDLDILVLREFDSKLNLGYELMADESSNSSIVDGAFMNFQANSPFVWLAMHYFVTEFRDEWGYQGPQLMTRSVQRYLRMLNAVPGVLPPLEVAPPWAFYPVHWNNASEVFHTARRKEMLNMITNSTYTFHLWNAISKNAVIETNSLVDKIVARVCPLIEFNE